MESLVRISTYAIVREAVLKKQCLERLVMQTVVHAVMDRNVWYVITILILHQKVSVAVMMEVIVRVIVVVMQIVLLVNSVM